jgi:hypothetical protein
VNWQKLKRRLESRNLVLCLRVMKLLRKELRTNRLLDLKDLWVVSRIQAQVMSTLATNARAGKTDAELARLRELMDKTPDEFREAFLDEDFRELLKNAYEEGNEESDRES